MSLPCLIPWHLKSGAGIHDLCACTISMLAWHSSTSVCGTLFLLASLTIVMQKSSDGHSNATLGDETSAQSSDGNDTSDAAYYASCIKEPKEMWQDFNGMWSIGCECTSAVLGLAGLSNSCAHNLISFEARHILPTAPWFGHSSLPPSAGSLLFDLVLNLARDTPQVRARII